MRGVGGQRDGFCIDGEQQWYSAYMVSVSSVEK